MAFSNSLANMELMALTVVYLLVPSLPVLRYVLTQGCPSLV